MDYRKYAFDDVSPGPAPPPSVLGWDDPTPPGGGAPHLLPGSPPLPSPLSDTPLQPQCGRQHGGGAVRAGYGADQGCAPRQSDPTRNLGSGGGAGGAVRAGFSADSGARSAEAAPYGAESEPSRQAGGGAREQPASGGSNGGGAGAAAPAARGGADARAKDKPGAVVWAKLARYPWWPAQVRRHPLFCSRVTLGCRSQAVARHGYVG